MREFFERLEAKQPKLPVWNGELYLEIHRGTYTTQAFIKRANRKTEFLLHDVEFLASLASLLSTEYEYPHSVLQESWRRLALNQFHDILPGSSVRPVYDDARKDFIAIQSRAGQERELALATLAGIFPGDILVFNPTSFTRDDLAWWPYLLDDDVHLERVDGTPVSVQPSVGGVWLDIGNVPPFGVVSLFARPGKAPSPTTSLSVTERLLENRFLRVEFDENGDIVRIFDKDARREVLAPGSVGNQFQAFEDRPLNWDAWDIDIFYDDKMWLAEPATSIRVAEAGPLRGTLEIRRRILNSDIVQRISLSHNSRRLDFQTKITWRERHILLKVAFPVDILSPRATYEIQWGHVERPTHRNTSWDWARFESVAQKWVDLSEGDYGVSLLNDCKYGHDVHENVLRLSLLRGPTLPDPTADLGEHEFTYSLLPHKGPLSEQTIAAAYMLNDPHILIQGIGGHNVSGPSPFYSLVHARTPHVVIETIKQAEDGQGLILRFYEAFRTRGPVELVFAAPVRAAWRCNLLEENEAQLDVQDGHVLRLQVRPFEIVTLRVEFKLEG